MATAGSKSIGAAKAAGAKQRPGPKVAAPKSHVQRQQAILKLGNVDFSELQIELPRSQASIEIEVRLVNAESGNLNGHGTLKVSRGGVRWVEAIHTQREREWYFPWAKFAEQIRKK